MSSNPQSVSPDPQSFDVLIVGAGPAGSYAAELLARAGFSVALFDGRPAGEPKPCGGGVTSKALKAYPHLLETTGRSIDELEMFAPSGKRLRLKLEEPFAIYARTTFDLFLRDRAAKAGARVFREKVALANNAESTDDGWTLRAYGKKEKAVVWRGKFLLAADGASSVIAQKLSGKLAKSEMEVAFGFRLPLPKDRRRVITTIAFLPEFTGYAWAFPRIEHVSFGIATTHNAFDHEKLDEMLWQFIVGFYQQNSNRGNNIWQNLKNAESAHLKTALFAQAERYAARIPGLSAETLSNRKTCGENWALLGDAAGFADAVTGEGIYYALRSAELFAASLTSGQPQNYETAWRADFGRELMRAATLHRKFYGNFFGAAFTERMIQIANVHGGIKKTLRELVAGDQGYTDLKAKLARRVFVPF